MGIWPDDYVEKVLKDVEKYNGVRKIVKAGLIERCAVKYCAPEKLHPNPEDEFSRENIGPNMEIVGNYADDIKFLQCHPSMDIFEEPMIVQKMEPDGYLLLNGHHRWFAAVRMHVKKVHIKIVNVVNSADINRMIDATTNSKLVTFDFDEVLLSADENNQAPLLFNFFRNKYKERLRSGAPDVIKAFQDKGYDVCVYTSGYLSEDDFKDFFSMYELEINIVINGLNDKRGSTTGKADSLKELLKSRYKRIVHVDNETLYDVDHVTKDYEMYEIDANGSWNEGTSKILDTLL